MGNSAVSVVCNLEGVTDRVNTATDIIRKVGLILYCDGAVRFIYIFFLTS
jgi:hypothetical protein